MLYRLTANGETYDRQESFLLTDDLMTEVGVLIQGYLDRYQVEFNRRDAKSVLGVGQAQVWGKRSPPCLPEFIMASDSSLLLADEQPRQTALSAKTLRAAGFEARVAAFQDVRGGGQKSAT